MTATPPRPWLPEDDEQLRALTLKGTTAASIAKRLERTEEAIRNRAQKLKVSFKRRIAGRLRQCRLLDLELRAKGK